MSQTLSERLVLRGEFSKRREREQFIARVKCCGYWIGVLFGALALAYDMSKGAW